MKKKRRIRPQELWNSAAIEQWLEEEAKRGWRLSDATGYLLTFQAAEPKACRVRIHPQGPETQADFRERIAAFEEMGWEFAAAICLDYEVFYCDDPEAPELHSDPQVYCWAWEKYLRISWISGWVTLAVALALIAIFCAVAGRTPVNLIVNLDGATTVLMFLLVPWAVVLSLRCLIRVGQARRQLRAGMMPQAKESPGISRIWWNVIIAGWLIWVLGVIGGNLWVLCLEPETEKLPYIPPTELAEGSFDEEWMPDWERWGFRSTLLAPTRMQLSFYDADGRSVSNSGEILLLEPLAKALYREKFNQFCRAHPAAEEKIVGESRFDEARLLTDGGVQMLLVRSGKLLYALEINFPVDMEACIDSVAESVQRRK